MLVGPLPSYLFTYRLLLSSLVQRHQFSYYICMSSSLEVSVTVSLLRSSELFSAFWPISKSEWLSLVLRFPILLDLLPNLLRSFRAHQLQQLSPSLLCSIAFLVRWQGLSTFFLLHFL